jgi:ubiquinone/menaquinone biosynthesis C-methylase UbiE
MHQTPAEHKQRTTAIFDMVAAGYDHPALRLFPFCADRLVNTLKPKPGHKILDIGTGTGAVATALAQAVLPGGRVQAIDLAQNMIDRAAHNVGKAGLTNVDFHVMDAERLDFKSRYFDHVVASYVLFFCPDVEAALKEWRRVLKPNGTVIFTTFTANAFEPYVSDLRQQLQHFGVEWPQGAFQRLASPEVCTDLLVAAGFEQIEVRSEALGYHLPGAEDWWQVLWNSGFRGLLERLDAQQLTQLRDKHMNAVAQHRDTDGLWLNAESLFCLGRRPAAAPE